MLVTKKNFDATLSLIKQSVKKEKYLGFDTETTCLHWWDSPRHKRSGLEPRVFSMQFSTADQEFYFDFLHSSDKLGAEHFKIINDELTQDPHITWFIANAKFDLHHSANHGVYFAGDVHCTKAIARVVNNLEEELGLDALGEKYLKVGKIDVISYLKEHSLFMRLRKFQSDYYEDILQFDRLPLEMLVEYGKKDTRLCYDLGKWQLKQIWDIDARIFNSSSRHQRLDDVYKNEMALTKVCFEMERVGVKIDIPYTEKAFENEKQEYKRIQDDLDGIAVKYEFLNINWLSSKQLKPIFDKLGEPYSVTQKGNASFDKDALEESTSELAKLILQYRYHYKRAHTYFENYLSMADSNEILHADAQQAGTGFGRMSYWTPNLQNVPKRQDKDESLYKVRKCFIPKPGMFFADFDYSGAEYLMTLDYANEARVIEMINAGLDPHEDLRLKMNLKDRDTAKPMQFRILYGAGQEAVGKSLGYKGFEAKRIGKIKKEEYFRNLPRVASLIKQVSDTASRRGYIFNWFGRVLNYDYDTSYKATNGLIQSGVGDMTKKAMVDLRAKVLAGKKTKMLLQVHDSILMEMSYDEIDLIPTIQSTMQGAYPHKNIQMRTDAGYSEKSWADLKDEIPLGNG